MATRLAGSDDRFGAKRRPSRGINYVVAHDGFTLADVVSYKTKHNDANGENGRDGSDENFSWNNGVEGATRDSRRCWPRGVPTSARCWRSCCSPAARRCWRWATELGQTQGGQQQRLCAG